MKRLFLFLLTIPALVAAPAFAQAQTSIDAQNYLISAINAVQALAAWANEMGLFALAQMLVNELRGLLVLLIANAEGLL